MNLFDADFRRVIMERHVEMVPLLEVTLTDGATAFMSDRRIEFAIDEEDEIAQTRVYVRRLMEFSGISQNIEGSSSTATFKLSNIDRVMELAARDHDFFRGKIEFKVFLPKLKFEEDQLFRKSTRLVFSGYITSTDYDDKEFTLHCKDGFFALSLPLPRRRLTRTCQFKFDDGTFCPYSGYGMKGRGSDVPEDFVPIENIQGVVGPDGETKIGNPGFEGSDFGPGPNFAGATGPLEGDAFARAEFGGGFTTCGKTFEDCHKRGMTRFFGGIRYVSSWATGNVKKGLFSKDPYVSFSAFNESVFNQSVPIVYASRFSQPKTPLRDLQLLAGEQPNYEEFPDEQRDLLLRPDNGYVMSPLIYQWRPENEFLAVECIVSSGRVGRSDPTYANLDTEGLKEVFVNGLQPGQRKGKKEFQVIQFPETPGFHVARSAGRVGETALWEQIGGTMQSADKWRDPITGDFITPPAIHTSGIAGFFVRVLDENAGINNTFLSQKRSESDSKYTPAGAPDVRVNVEEGRKSWRYLSVEVDPETAPFGVTREFGAPWSVNPAWVFYDLFLEAFQVRYTDIPTHLRYTDLSSFIQTGIYCDEVIPNILSPNNPDLDVQRYAWVGTVSDGKPAIDQLDGILRDMYGFRFWRNGKLAIHPYTACQFDQIQRPAFQEFVNIIDGSLDVKIPEVKFNELHLQFADQDFDFQKNDATVYSETHQELIGSEGGLNVRYPLTRTLNMPGTPTTDQASRVGAVMLKDHLGGSTIEEWRILREYELQTPFFMQELEIGDVTYIAHTLVPHGGQWVRVTGWTLNNDFTITFALRTFNINNYDDTVIGVSSVELAKFGFNPFIPGSGGIQHLALPPLLWVDEAIHLAEPIDAEAISASPGLGVELRMLGYELYPEETPFVPPPGPPPPTTPPPVTDPHLDYVDPLTETEKKEKADLLLGVNIFRTPGTRLQLTLAAGSTLAKVHKVDQFEDLPLPFFAYVQPPDFDPRDPDKDHFEIVKVTIIDTDTCLLTVERAQEGSPNLDWPRGSLLFADLKVGGWLAADATAGATRFVVGADPFDFRAGRYYEVGASGEIVLVTGVIPAQGGEPNKIDVDRGQLDTEAQPHRKFAQVRDFFHSDQTPDFDNEQLGRSNVFRYLDPWEPTPSTTTASTTTSTTT